jgi:hypothetical protein
LHVAVGAGGCDVDKQRRQVARTGTGMGTTKTMMIVQGGGGGRMQRCCTTLTGGGDRDGDNDDDKDCAWRWQR